MRCFTVKLSLLFLFGALLLLRFERADADTASKFKVIFQFHLYFLGDEEEKNTEDDNDCFDMGSNCNIIKAANLCNNQIYAKIADTYCKQTCNKCGSNTASNQANCKDNSRTCFQWNANGFCQSAFYTADQKRQSCEKTCNLC